MTKATLLLFLPWLVSAADVAGQWNLRLIRFGEEFASARVELKTEGAHVAGALNELKLEGAVEADRVRLTATRPDGKEWGTLEGQVQGDDIAGTVKQGDEEFAWKAHRIHPVNSA